MGDSYVAAGYLATAFGLITYALYVRHRGRALGRALAGRNQPSEAATEPVRSDDTEVRS